MANILVVDDETILLTLMDTVLSRKGHEVVLAGGGHKGVEMFRQNHPDVVITDIFMPNRDGIEVVMELKRSCPRTTIIAMTGGGQRCMMEITSPAKLLGTDHILHKPFARESLVAAVNAALGTPPPPRSQHGA